MRSFWSGSISFGLVNIPIKLYTATESHTLDLHLLRDKDLCPISFARVCRVDGEEVPWEHIVRGYEYAKGDYVILEKEDFEKADVKKTHTIDISTFVDEKEVDTIFFEKPYYLEPQKTGAKAYALLCEALRKSKKVGVGNYVLRQKEHIGIIKAYGNLIVLNQLRYHDEIRDQSKLNLPDKESINDKELKIALQLIDQLTGKFKPEEFSDEYIDDLKKIIEAKAQGKEIKHIKQVPTEGKEVADIMSLLKESLQQAKRNAA